MSLPLPPGPPGPNGRPGLVIRSYAQRERARRVPERLRVAAESALAYNSGIHGARVLGRQIAAALERERADVVRAVRASAGWFEKPDGTGRVVTRAAGMKPTESEPE